MRIFAITLSMLFACAHAPPPQELVYARSAYLHAQAGPAARLTPAELHDAYESLQYAERAYAKDATSQDAIDWSYIAWRDAQRADALGVAANAAGEKARADRALTKTQSAMISDDEARIRAQKETIEKERDSADRAWENTADERAARLAAEQKAREAMDALGKSLATKTDERGTVITLSGGVLFVTNQATLLPGAQAQLNLVADALKTQAEHHFVVGGHTDDQGTDRINDDLSQRRANAVRDYLVVHGVSANAITAQGFGSHQPIGDNKTIEGRAMNRRVEIIVQPDVTAAR